MNQVSLQLQGHFSDDSSVCVHSQVEKARSREQNDRQSHNVVVFGVPESRDLLGTDSRVFESVVGRKVTTTDSS